MSMGNAVMRRDDLDICKGLGMLLVIVGHTVTFPLLRGTIFSFHMPLFFLIAGVNYRRSKTIKEFNKHLIKSFKRLIMPAIFLYSVRTFGYALFGKLDFRTRDFLLAVTYSSGVEYESRFGPVSSVGMVWFLVCLFECKAIYDVLFCKFGDKAAVVVVVFACLSIYISKLTWLPFSFDVTLVVLLFFFIGVMENKYGFIESLCKHPKYLVCLFIFGGVRFLNCVLQESILSSRLERIRCFRYAWPSQSLLAWSSWLFAGFCQKRRGAVQPRSWPFAARIHF